MDNIVIEIKIQFLSLKQINDKFCFLYSDKIYKTVMKYLKTEANKSAGIYNNDINDEFLGDMKSLKNRTLAVHNI